MKTQLKSVGDVDKDVEYVLIIFGSTSVFIPGDERSRTNPGHGYPESTETYSTPQIYSFRNRAELLEELNVLYDKDRNRKDVLVIEVNRLAFAKTTLLVDI